VTSQSSPRPTSSLRRSDALLAAAVVGIVAMMIIPLPTIMLV
jgi:type III secretory pathway component EscV